MRGYHWLLLLVVGYLLGYYFRQVGNMTIGKLWPAV